MTSCFNVKDTASDSQNFTLHLSEESAIEDTPDLVADETRDKDDIIVISDSSSDLSYGYAHRPYSKSASNYNINDRKKTTYPRSHVYDISSEDEEEKLDSKLSEKYRNKSRINVNKSIYTSDEATLSSIDRTYCDRTLKNRTNQHDTEKLCKTPTLTLAEQKMADKYSTREMDRVVTPSNTMQCSKLPSRLHQFEMRNTPQHNSAEKIKLTKEDARNIWRNIKQTRITYASPRERKENNIIINESTDIDEDVIHPAVSPRRNKKLMHRNDNRDVIDTSLQDNIVPDSRKNSPSLSRVHNHIVNHIPKEEQLHRPLSERKKRQIAEWLMTNSPDSRSDSSCSNVPPSTRHSRDSGNSSLERLELKYETPNNRGTINKAETINKAQRDGNQTPIMSTRGVMQSVSTHQTTLDRYIREFRKDNSEFKTPDKAITVAKTAEETSQVNKETPEMGIKDCTDILDKLYGKSWRDKANALLPTSEPRKPSVQTMNRAVQTERKAVKSKKQCYVTDSDSGDSDSDKNRIQATRKKDREKPRKLDSFINDESLSDNDSESMYHTALTNPRTSTNSTASRPMAVPASVKRLQTICDTDTESDKTSNDSKKDLGRRKLVFDDDDNDGSSTSEYDPGDYVPPRTIYRKEIAKTSQLPKTAPRSASTNISVTCKSFLASLSSTVPMSNAHPDARKYRSDYKTNKEALCKVLYKLYNERVFDDKLPLDMPIEWNIRMRGTAGYCYNKKSVKSLSGVVKSSRIVLATKILDTPDRLRDTLIHEMCHAAAWLLNDVSDGHGPFWTGWANKAMKMFPELPPIRRCHDYEIKTKFTYRCTVCGYSIGRHSKSLDIEKKRCGHCYGKFELLINKTTKSGIVVQVQTPKKEPSGFALYVKENYNSVRKEKGAAKHADVMKILGQQFSAIKIAKQTDTDMPDYV